jgi:hypothetical protein
MYLPGAWLNQYCTNLIFISYIVALEATGVKFISDDGVTMDQLSDHRQSGKGDASLSA